MAPKPQLAAGGKAVPILDAAVDELIADCGGDARLNRGTTMGAAC